MEKKEKTYIQLRVGLVLKKILDGNKAIAKENKENDVQDNNLITSFGKLEAASGITKAMLVAIVNGKKNPATTTLVAIIEALGMSFSEFGSHYDSITDKEIDHYGKQIGAIKKTPAKKKG